MEIVAYVFSIICLALNGSLFFRFKAPFSFYFVIFPLVAGGLAPVLLVISAAAAALGWFSQAYAAFALGSLAAGISLAYMVLVTAPHGAFAQVFGADWEDKIPQAARKGILKRRWRLGLPATPQPVFEQNVPFWKIPGTERELLCDLWLPAQGVERSGLALIYHHGSGWHFLDKDMGTRPLFRQLTAQGHVVMDVAYRLTPEVDIFGMVGDVKRAVAWMKDNAVRYGVNLARVVLGGGSAGGHIALLAAYTAENARLMPEELAGRDLSVRAVVSFYGPTDLEACYRHLKLERTLGMPKLEIGQAGAATMQKTMRDAGRLDILLGGHPQEVPEMYALASPVTHVRADCPPTLMIQGKPDVIAPTSAAQEMHRKLVACGVPAVNLIYPLTDHAFDLLFPQISPPAQAAFYDLERFLALMV